MWIKLAFMIPAGLNCSDNGLTPTMTSYVADVIDEKLRTTAYGVTYAIAASSLIVAMGIAIFISVVFYTELNFTVITIINVIQLFYIAFFVKESLSKNLRKKINKKNFNPFKPLLQFRKHPIVAWIAMVQFFASLPGIIYSIRF